MLKTDPQNRHYINLATMINEYNQKHKVETETMIRLVHSIVSMMPLYLNFDDTIEAGEKIKKIGENMIEFAHIKENALLKEIEETRQ